LNARAFIEDTSVNQDRNTAVRYKQVREEGKGLTPFLKKGERATWKLVTVVQRI